MKKLTPYLGAAGLGFLAAGLLLRLLQPERGRIFSSFLIAGLGPVPALPREPLAGGPATGGTKERRERERIRLPSSSSSWESESPSTSSRTGIRSGGTSPPLVSTPFRSRRRRSSPGSRASSRSCFSTTLRPRGPSRRAICSSSTMERARKCPSRSSTPKPIRRKRSPIRSRVKPAFPMGTVLVFRGRAARARHRGDGARDYERDPPRPAAGAQEDLLHLRPPGKIHRRLGPERGDLRRERKAWRLDLRHRKPDHRPRGPGRRDADPGGRRRRRGRRSENGSAPGRDRGTRFLPARGGPRRLSSGSGGPGIDSRPRRVSSRTGCLARSRPGSRPAERASPLSRRPHVRRPPHRRKLCERAIDLSPGARRGASRQRSRGFRGPGSLLVGSGKLGRDPNGRAPAAPGSGARSEARSAARSRWQ